MADSEPLSGVEKSNSLDIYEIKTKKSSIPQRAVMKNGTLPRFPCSFMISGRSGSGKTNLLINVLTRKEFYKNYFHYIVVYSPTASKYDDMYAELKLPPENFVPEFGEEQLRNLIDARKKLIEEKGIEWVGRHSRCLIILDDIIANRKFLESQTALTLFALLRHYLCSIIVMMQSYNKLPRALRLNCNALAVFPATQSEIEVLKDEITPAGITKKDFEKVIEYATDKPFSFLYINNHAKKGEQIRRNLTDIIDINDYKKK